MKIFLLTLVLLSPLILIKPSHSEALPPTVCADRAEIVKKLASKFEEEQRGMGLNPKKSVVELWTNKETGTFTVLETFPDGRACLTTSGNMWIDIEGKPIGEKL